MRREKYKVPCKLAVSGVRKSSFAQSHKLLKKIPTMTSFMTFAQQSKRSLLMNTKPDHRTINSTFNFNFNSLPIFFYYYRSRFELFLKVRVEDEQPVKKSLRPLCLRCSNYTNFCGSPRETKKKTFFITNFRSSFNVEVARLPIVCLAAINRHSFFHIKCYLWLQWALVSLPTCLLPRPICHDARDATRGKWNIKTIKTKGALSVTHWRSSELWLLVTRTTDEINNFSSSLQQHREQCGDIKIGKYRLLMRVGFTCCCRCDGVCITNDFWLLWISVGFRFDSS